MLDAWDRVPPSIRREWTLLFVGEGRAAIRLEVATTTHMPGEIVHVPGATPLQLAELYVASDLLVLPTLGEPWGIVVHEAMACGLPVLCSVHAGCAADLVEPGQTGWLTDPRDEPAFRDTLVEALTSGRRIRLGELARARVSRFTPEAMARGFRSAVHDR